MKHAVSFRNQVIENARKLRQPDGVQAGGMFDAFNPRYLMPQSGGEYDDMDGNPWDDINLAPENETFDQLRMEVERAFGGQLDDTEDEDDDDDDPGVLFNYKEKCFEEDDISDLGDNIVITIPDEMRERKCQACRQRFMLKESYEEHAKECIELKLNKIITDGQQLLQMRQSRTLSANEFVRRMIYALKKVMKSLSVCYKESGDQSLALGVDDKLSKKMNLFDLTDDTFKPKKPMNNDPYQIIPLSSIAAPIVGPDPTISMPSIVQHQHHNHHNHHHHNHHHHQQQQNEQQNKYLLDLLEGKPNVSIQKNHLAERVGPMVATTSTAPNPLFASIMHSNQSKIAASMQPLGSVASQLALALAQSKRIEKPSFMTEPNAIVAQCSQCSESFTSIGAFEEHIRQNHTNRSTPIQSPAATVVNISVHFHMRINGNNGHLLILKIFF